MRCSSIDYGFYSEWKETLNHESECHEPECLKILLDLVADLSTPIDKTTLSVALPNADFPAIIDAGSFTLGRNPLKK
jgi:hypothetical protein